MAGNDSSITRDFSSENSTVNGNTQHSDTADAALQKIRTSGSVVIDAELFEKLYLQPQLKGGVHPLQKVLGNPTPLAILGFEMSLMPITMDLMGWRGAGGGGASDNADVIFYGGVLMWVGGFLEFILGNTFPFLVFMSFGSFYISYGSTMIPLFASFAQFAKPGDSVYTGLVDPQFNASYGFYWVAFTILMFFYTLCVLRTNVVFVAMFLTITPAVGCITALYFYVAQGMAAEAHRCQLTAGALLFATCIFGWYLFAGLILPTVDFPLAIPLGDLSHVVPGLSDLQEKRKGGTGKKSLFSRKSKHEGNGAV